MNNRARLVGETPRGFRSCVFPCQKLDADGRRIQRECSVSVDPAYQGKVWQWSGSPDAPTLSPSIDCDSKPCWHGFIVDGEVRHPLAEMTRLDEELGLYDDEKVSPTPDSGKAGGGEHG